ncbi:MAG: DUF4232 domain-containing protein [Streptosporangiaceae bacterium]
MWSQAVTPRGGTSHPQTSLPPARRSPASDSPARRSPASHPGAGRRGVARYGVWAAALLCVAVTAGCASAVSSSTPPAAPASPATTAAASTPAAAPTLTPSATAAPACATSALLVRLGVAEGYAGGADYVIDFTNQSGAACTMYGYPGVSLVSGPPYAQIGLAAQRDSTAPVKLVTLIPGAMATALLRVADALNYPSGTCRPVTATHLRVYPPNQTAPVYLASTPRGCAALVQTLFIGAVQASSRMKPQASTAGQSG